jgi:hypothetical protein
MGSGSITDGQDLYYHANPQSRRYGKHLPVNLRTPTAHQLFFSDSSPEERQRLETGFFMSLLLPVNGTYKTTYHRRFDDLNELVLRHLPSKRPLQIMDVAVSSGVSTAEWTMQLRAAGVAHRMVAGDLVVRAFLIEVSKYFRVLVDRDARLLQVDVNGRGIFRPEAVRGYPGRLWSFCRDAPMLAAGFAVAAAAGPAIRSSSNRAGKTLGMRYRPLDLVSSALSSLPDVQIIEDDILADTPTETVDVLRAANILNKVYFDESTLEQMVRNLRRRLRPGGLMIVCRTDYNGNFDYSRLDYSGINKASLFQLNSDGKFEVRARLNAGSEIEELVLRTPA